MALNSISEIIEDIRNGKMVVLMDDEDRENEGDLVMAASMVRPDDINFMARFGRGLICLTLTKERCTQLNLPLMVQNNGAAYSTNFTLSIEAAEGVTTGISAADRARTVQAAVASHAKPSDLVQPGHIFPLMAQPGGVLSRAGHTEAGCDLARLAGLEPAAVIVEVLNEDGTMARRPDLEKFAAEHDLKIGTIADLIHYRTLHETTVQKVGECHWPTPMGDFRLHSFQDTIDGRAHFALVKGDVADGEPVLTRVHVTDLFADIMLQQRGEHGSWSLQNAMQRVADEGRGVIVVLQGSHSQEGLLEQAQRFEREDQGIDSIQPSASDAVRRIGTGSQILTSLGVHKLRLLSPVKKYLALSGFDLEIVEFISDE